VTDPDPFDEIVRDLDLDLDFSEPAPAARPQPTHPSAVGAGDDGDGADNQDDQFYRRVEPRPVLPRSPRVLLAWIGVVAAPLWIVISSTLHLIMPRPVLLGCGLVFVASAIYLIAQLPERGPSEPYWPDDGAQL
jgi:hypothetical protein